MLHQLYFIYDALVVDPNCARRIGYPVGVDLMKADVPFTVNVWIYGTGISSQKVKSCCILKIRHSSCESRNSLGLSFISPLHFTY